MSIVQVGLFAGGVAVGVTGAYLIRPSQASSQEQKVVPQSTTTTSASSQPDIFQEKLNLSLLSGYSPEDNQLIGPGGYPGPVSDFLRHAAFISSYDRRMRHPSWTAEHITATSLTIPNDGKPNRKNSVFREDERIPTLFRARLADYFKSGYGESIIFLPPLAHRMLIKIIFRSRSYGSSSRCKEFSRSHE